MKRFVSIIICVLSICSLCMTSFAVSRDDTTLDSQLHNQYDFYTVELSTPTSNLQTNTLSINLTQQNISNILAAKEYVKSLNLASKGFPELQEQCLSELDSFLEESSQNADKVLAEYTVLVPKTAAASYTYYGEKIVQNIPMKCYYNFTSAAGWDVGKKQLTVGDWVNGSVNFVMAFSPTWKISLAFTTVQSLVSGYDIKPADRVEGFWRVNQTYRNIYVKDDLNRWKKGVGAYVLVYKSDVAKVTPYVMVYKDVPRPPYAEELDFKPQSYMAHGYEDKTYVLNRTSYRYFDANNRSILIDNALDDINIIKSIKFEKK